MRTYTTLDDPLGTNGTMPEGINDNGQIVGDYLDSAGNILFHGFLYSNGTYTTLDDPLGTNGTIPWRINNNGQIVGTYYDNVGSGAHGFLYSNGTYTTLNDPLGTGTFNGINDHGKIVGLFIDSNYKEHGFLYSNGAYTTLNDPHGTFGTAALDINDHGKIVGLFINSNHVTHGFLYSNGTYTTLNDPLGTYGTVASGINDHGKIVGYFIDSNHVDHGFLYSNGTYTTLDDPLATLNGSAALGINSGTFSFGHQQLRKDRRDLLRQQPRRTRLPHLTARRQMCHRVKVHISIERTDIAEKLVTALAEGVTEVAATSK